MDVWICALLMAAGLWLVGRSIIIEKTADINEMGLALVMGGMGMVIFAAALSWAAWRLYLASGY